MPLAKSQNITQPNTQIFKFLLLGNSVGCHSNNIQKLESGEFFFGFFIFQNTVLEGEESGFYLKLEKALRALASSSGGAACPGVPGVNPGGRPQESGGDSKAI